MLIELAVLMNLVLSTSKLLFRHFLKRLLIPSLHYLLQTLDVGDRRDNLLALPAQWHTYRCLFYKGKEAICV